MVEIIELLPNVLSGVDDVVAYEAEVAVDEFNACVEYDEVPNKEPVNTPVNEPVNEPVFDKN